MHSKLLMLCALCALMPGFLRPAHAAQRLELREGWQLKACSLVPESPEVVSTGKFKPRKWHPVTVPSTVLAALIRNQVYPDLRIGTNAFLIPDSSDEFNLKHDLAKYGYLPDKRNPWREPYWYRTRFELPALPSNRHFWLHFDAINYRAEVWLNGRQIAQTNDMVGMFQRFQYDITRDIHRGGNVLAVKVFPVDHPGTPDSMLQPLGKDRGYVGKEIMRDVTEIVTIGYDCMMTVPDRNMGLWQPVWIDWTGLVDIRDPFVVTDLPLPETNRATLGVSAELVNVSDAPVKGTLHGTIPGTKVAFAQRVELGPGEKRIVAVRPPPVMETPRLWWPVNYGEQHLYDLTLQFVADGVDWDVGILSAEKRVRFGVREIGYEMHELNGWHGRRVLVNGQRIFCRGGYIQPELIFDWNAQRMENEIRYYAGANLNLIYYEDIPNPPEPFLELCDRYGLLFGHCAYSCYWLRPGTPYPDDLPLLERSTVDMLKRYRNHPSLLFYMAMNEAFTKEEVYRMWRRHVLELDGTRWLIPSAHFPSDRKDAGAWFKPDLPAGMTDIGASYSWAEPEQYFRWVREARNWMFMMEGGSASLPPISSLAKFLPGLNAHSTERGPLFPLDSAWAHHGANNYFQGYDQALRRLHGEPESVADYCWKGHLVTADQHRSIFEAVNHRLWDITSGMTQWKINTCEPTVQWQIFDYYHKPMVSWFYIKNACEPLHAQLNLLDKMVSVINTRPASQPGLEVHAQVFDLDSKLIWQKKAKVDVPANGYREAFAVPEPTAPTPIYFVKINLHDRQGQTIADNFYWLRAKNTPDYQALQALKPVSLNSTLIWEPGMQGNNARVRVSNPTDRIAFFIQLALTINGTEILPVMWEDNYFSLLPRESREITAKLGAQVARRKPNLEIGGWNILTPFSCVHLDLSDTNVKPHQPITVTAALKDTFLDGSRLWLLVDGKPTQPKWAWARDKHRDTLQFTLSFADPGRHEIALGNKKASIRVQP